MAIRDEYNETARIECGHMTRDELLDRIGFLFMKSDRLTQDVHRARDDLNRAYSEDSR